MSNKTNHYPLKRSYGFQGILAFLVVALATLGGYVYYTGSHASGYFIGVAASPNGSNIWKVDIGGCVNGGGAFCNTAHNGTMVGIAAYGKNDSGYYLAASDGGVFSIGGAQFYGSMGGKNLSAPVRAIASRPDGNGYWLLGSDGAVYSFPSDPNKYHIFYGRASGGNDYVSMTSTPSGNGYWIARSSGQVYAFGDASGTSNPGAGLAGITGTTTGAGGYWALMTNGAVSQVGAATAEGSFGGTYSAITTRGVNAYNCILGLTTGGTVNQRCHAPVSHISAVATTIAYGGSTTVSWWSQYATGCSTNPNLGGGTSGANTTGALTSARTYSVTCTNWLSASSSDSVTVNVNAKTHPSPTPSPTPGPTPSPTPTPSPSPSGAGSHSGGSTGGGSVATPDTSPPSIPDNFVAALNDQVVNLSWNASTDNVGVDHYELDRSLDQTVWTSLNSSVGGTTYTDTTAGYGTTYFYRVRALDAAGNASDYADAQITTGQFTANSQSDQDTIVNSDDNIVTVTIPAGAFTDAAQCSIVTDSDHADKLPLKKSALITGPYSLLCKKASGDNITSFNTAVNFSVALTADQMKRYKGFTYYSYDSGGDNWSKFKTTYNKKTKVYTFSTNTAVQFAVLGSIKKGLSVQVIILIIMFIFLIAGVAYYLYQRAQKQSYQEYIRKKYYNL